MSRARYLPAAGAAPAFEACGGSENPCAWDYPGPVGVSVTATAPPGHVVIGLEVCYREPARVRPPAGSVPAAPPDRTYAALEPPCETTSDCPVGEVCAPGGGPGYCTGALPIPMTVAGGVLGITKLLCAPAISVARGDDVPAVEVDLGYDPGLSALLGVTRGALIAPAGHALDGVQIVYDAQGATQIACTYRAFAPGTSLGSRARTQFLPERPSPSTFTLTTTLGCFAAGADLFMQGIRVALTEDSLYAVDLPAARSWLGAVAVGCADCSAFWRTGGGTNDPAANGAASPAANSATNGAASGIVANGAPKGRGGLMAWVRDNPLVVVLFILIVILATIGLIASTEAQEDAPPSCSPETT